MGSGMVRADALERRAFFPVIFGRCIILAAHAAPGVDGPHQGTVALGGLGQRRFVHVDAGANRIFAGLQIVKQRAVTAP